MFEDLKQKFEDNVKYYENFIDIEGLQIDQSLKTIFYSYFNILSDVSLKSIMDSIPNDIKKSIKISEIKQKNDINIKNNSFILLFLIQSLYENYDSKINSLSSKNTELENKIKELEQKISKDSQNSQST